MIQHALLKSGQEIDYRLSNKHGPITATITIQKVEYGLVHFSRSDLPETKIEALKIPVADAEWLIMQGFWTKHHTRRGISRAERLKLLGDLQVQIEQIISAAGELFENHDIDPDSIWLEVSTELDRRWFVRVDRSHTQVQSAE